MAFFARSKLTLITCTVDASSMLRVPPGTRTAHVVEFGPVGVEDRVPQILQDVHSPNHQMSDGVNAAAVGTRMFSAAVLDQRLIFPFAYAPTTLASHHQKNVILSS